MKLAKYIHDLLFEHDKVIIPGFGAFVGKPQPAKIHGDGQRLSPPKKEIIFDPVEKHADNLLARHISKSENITQIAAKKAIDDFVNETIKELKKMAPEVLVPMHCTGWKAIQRFSDEFPSSFTLNSVGSEFTLS